MIFDPKQITDYFFCLIINSSSRVNNKSRGSIAVKSSIGKIIFLVGQISDSFSLTKHLCLLEEFNTQQQFDIIYFDAFSPSEQPELWTETVFKKMYDLLHPNGVLVTYCAQGQMKRNMKQAGFIVKALPGFGSKREMTKGEK